jgi:2-oxo-3-(phosphooxy)propyl 3-oxoalkanoate synthase
MSAGASGLAPPVRVAHGWPVPQPAELGMTTRTTVDRYLAHKHTTEHVFINDVARDGDVLVALGGLPTMHRFFNDSAAPGHDVLLMAEFIRQGVEVIAHALLGVPLNSQFVLRTVELQLVRPQPGGISDQATPAVVTFPDRQVRRNRSGLAYAASGPVHCHIGGRLAARLGGTVAFMDRDAYDELRSASGTPRLGEPSGSVAPCAPGAVGRQFRENVFIGQPQGPPREARCLVVARPHPAYFDRPLDHYPGMMIAEAARQLAASSVAADAGIPVTSVSTDFADLNFLSFAELDPPVALGVAGWADLADGVELTVVARQGTRVTSTCRFRMAGGSREHAS